MTGLLFVLTLAFAGYVVREVFRTVSETSNARRHAAVATPSTATASPTPVAAEEETVIAPAAEVATETAPPEAAEETTITAAVPTEAAAEAAKPTEPAPAPAAERGANLRNPATGEIAVIPTNYRFAKKWIKEALVAEGLL
ncbi:hypothetical protein, partial [Methylomagnum sp.]